MDLAQTNIITLDSQLQQRNTDFQFGINKLHNLKEHLAFIELLKTELENSNIALTAHNSELTNDIIVANSTIETLAQSSPECEKLTQQYQGTITNLTAERD